MNQPDFSFLTPQLVQEAVEQAFSLRLDGSLVPYNSYINRVFGLRDDDRKEYVVKFYRPGRWSFEAIEEEHQFILDCATDDLPVSVPIVTEDGESLVELEVPSKTGSVEVYFAVFPKKGGRNFDAETDDDWLRLGRLLGRLHQTGKRRKATQRTRFKPDETTELQIDELLNQGLIHPDFEDDFADLCTQVLAAIPSFHEEAHQRIHGDCHRGNILDRPGDGLFLMDFDDMAVGPVVQDLWLLLPGALADSRREVNLLSEGYEDFNRLDQKNWDLVEPLRFMRMIHFLAWTARQRTDVGFNKNFPFWGNRAFWEKELEDLRVQADLVFP